MGYPMVGQAALSVSSGFVTLATAGAIDTKGAWTQLVAATARAASAMHVTLRSTGSAGDDNAVVDIGIGGAGSEAVIVPNLMVSMGTAGNDNGRAAVLPVTVPPGVRLAARKAVSDLGVGAMLSVGLITGGFDKPPTTGVGRTYGAGASSGTAVDPGAVANTLGAWTNIGAATSHAATAILVDVINPRDGSGENARWMIDVGWSQGGSDRVIIPRLAMGSATGDDTPHQGWMGPFLVPVPAGVQLKARAQCTSVGATTRVLQMALHLFS